MVYITLDASPPGRLLILEKNLFRSEKPEKKEARAMEQLRVLISEFGFKPVLNHESGFNVVWSRIADDDSRTFLYRTRDVGVKKIIHPMVMHWYRRDIDALRNLSLMRKFLTGVQPVNYFFEPRSEKRMTMTTGQVEMVSGILGVEKVLLNAETGTGKTAGNLIAIENVLRFSPHGSKWLIVCKQNLIDNAHMKDAGVFTRLKLSRIDNPGAASAKNIAAMFDGQVIITTMDMIKDQVDMIEHYLGNRVIGVTIDEAHNFLNRNARGEAVSDLLYRIRPKYVVPMTGTPFNKAYKGWTYLDWILGKDAPPYDKWLEFSSYVYRKSPNRDPKNDMRRDRKGTVWIMKDLLCRNIVQVKKASLNLPPIHTEKIELELSQKSRDVMVKMIDELLFVPGQKSSIITCFKGLKRFVADGKIDVGELPSNMLEIAEITISNKLRQICSGFVYDENKDVVRFGYEKFNALLGIVSRHKKGTKFFICCAFGGSLDLLEKELSKELETDALRIDGSVSGKKQGEIISEFQTNPDRTLLLSQDSCIAEGITLTAATVVILFEQNWSYILTDQIRDRVHRLGQNKETHMYFLVAKGTIEEAMSHVVASRRKNGKAMIMEVFNGKGREFWQKTGDEEMPDMPF